MAEGECLEGAEEEEEFLTSDVATFSTLFGIHSSMSIPSVATVSPVAERFFLFRASRRSLLN
jgi:hypothetical protein